MPSLKKLFNKEESQDLKSKTLSNQQIDQMIASVDAKKRCDQVKEIENIEPLLYFLKKENDQIVIYAIESQLCGLLIELDNEVDITEICSHRYSDVSARSLAAQAKNEKLRKAMLSQLTDPVSIYEVVETTDYVDTKTEAIQKITDPALLKTVIARYKNKQKNIYRAAKDRLSQILEEENQKAKLDQAIVLLNESVANHSVSEGQLIQFKELFANCSQPDARQVEKYEQAVSEAEQAVQFIKTAQHTRKELCEKVHEIADSVQFATTNLSLKEFNSHLIQYQKDWVELDDWNSAEAKALLFRFEEEVSRANKYSSQFFKSKQVITQHQKLLKQAQKQLSKPSQLSEKLIADFKGRWSRLENLQDPELKTTLESEFKAKISELEDKLSKNKKEQLTNESEFQQLLERLKASLEAGKTDDAFATEQKIKKILNSDAGLSKKAHDSIYSQYQMLEPQVQELRHWQKFGADQVRSELIEKMQELKDDQKLDIEEKANQIKLLQEKWKTLSGRASDKVWKKFQEMSDQAWAPCAEHFKKARKESKENLQKIVTQLKEWEKHINAIDWENPNWSEVMKSYHQFEKDWRARPKVKEYDTDQIYRQFRKVDKKWQSHLEGERQKEKARRENMILQAKALLELEDRSNNLNQIKRLQTSWRPTVALKHRKDEQKLWEQFKTICDQVFADIKMQRSAHKQEVSANVTSYQTQLGQLEERLQQINEISDLKKNWNEGVASLGHFSGVDSKHKKQLENQLKELEALYKGKILAAKQAEKKLYLDALKAKDVFCTQLESVKLTSEQEIEAARAKWRELDIQAGKKDNQFEERLNKGLSAELQSNQNELLQKAEDLLLTFEMATGQDSPKAFQAKRQVRQLEYLKNAMQGDKALDQHKTEEGIYQLQCQWYLLEKPVDPSVREALSSRFEQVVERLNSESS